MHIVDPPAYAPPANAKKPQQKTPSRKSNLRVRDTNTRVVYAKQQLVTSASDNRVDSVRKAPRGGQALSTYN
jgi:hypothetical protein